MVLNLTMSQALWASDKAIGDQQSIYGYDDMTEYTEFEHVLLHGLGLGCNNMKILDDDDGSVVGYLEDSATTIQALVRGVLARKRVLNILLGIMAARIQGCARAMATRKILQQEQSSIVIQKATRGMLARKRLRQEQKCMFRGRKSKNKKAKKTRMQRKTIEPEKAASNQYPQEIMMGDGIVEATIEETPILIEEEEEAGLGSVPDQPEAIDEVPAMPNHKNHRSANTVEENTKKAGFFARIFGKIGKKKSNKSNVRIVIYEKSLEDTSLEDNDSFCFSL